MNFTNPGLLGLLPLSLIPPLLHLLSLRRARKVMFSDLSLLRTIEARSLPRRRLRSWLLALLRALLLAALIVAWAGPVVSRDEPGTAGADGGIDLVAILDSSYSMGYRVHGKTRFETARSAGENIIRGLKNADRVAVAVFSDRIEYPAEGLRWARSTADAVAALSRSRLSRRGTDLCAAFRAAQTFLSSQESQGRARRRVVLMLSDSARHSLDCELPEPDPGVLRLGLEWADEPENGYLTSVRPAPESDAAAPVLSVRAAAAGGRVRETGLALSMDGDRIRSAALRLSPDGSAEVSLRLPIAGATPSGPGRSAWAGRAELDTDALSLDDRYYFSFRHVPRPRVLCLFGHPGFFSASAPGYFFKELFGSGKGSLLEYDGDFAELGRLSEVALSDYRVVILADFKELSEAAVQSLGAFVRGGGGLLVIPGPGVPNAAFAGLSRLLPASVGPEILSRRAYGISAGTEPVWKEFDLRKVAVRRYRRLAPRAGSDVLFRTAAGEPLLVRRKYSAGTVGVWASPLDLSSTNLPLKPVFAAWARTALGAVRGEAQARTEVRQLFVGESITLSWKEAEPLPARVRVRAPDGKAVLLWPKDRSVVYDATGEPGLYTVIEEGRTTQSSVYAVNIDRTSESDVTRIDDPPWKGVRADDAREGFRRALFGKDVRAIILALAALLLSLEMLLSMRRLGRRMLVFLAFLFPALACQVPSVEAAAPSAKRSGRSGDGGPSAAATASDRFVWTQLRLGSGWDPYPDAHREVVELFGRVTSVLVWPERRVLGLRDGALFESPLVVLAGRTSPPALTPAELKDLRSFISGGGMLWIEDVSGLRSSPFDRWVRKLLPVLLPEAKLAPLPADHVVYKTFFLLRGPSGRVMLRPSLEGVIWGGRVAVLYSRNDLLGAWAKDGLGRPLLTCTPGGERQRHNAKKLTLNILMYSLTGSYKSDAVHQPFLLQKMRRGIP